MFLRSLDQQTSTARDTRDTEVIVASMVFLIALSALNFFRIGCQLVVVSGSAIAVTSRASAVGQVFIALSVANLAVAPVAGLIVDYVIHKKRLLLAGYAGIVVSGIVPAAIPLVAGIQPGLAGIIASVLGASISTMISSGAMDAFLKTSIPADSRPRKLAALSSANQVALIAGTAGGGFLVAYVPWPTAFLMLSLCGAALALLTVAWLPRLAIKRQTELPLRRGILSFGPSLYLRHQELFLIACCSAAVYSVGQVSNTLLPALVKIQMGLSASSYSTAEGCWSAGALLAALALAKLTPGRFGDIGFDLVVILAMAGLLAIIASTPALPQLFAIHFVLGIGFSFVRIRNECRFISECPAHLLGRFRANSAFLISLTGIAVFATPSLFDDWPISNLYLLLSTIIAIATVALSALLLSTRRPLRPSPE